MFVSQKAVLTHSGLLSVPLTDLILDDVAASSLSATFSSRYMCRSILDACVIISITPTRFDSPLP